MAALSEIWSLIEEPALRQKVSAACLIAAEAIRTEDSGTANHTNRLKWAKAALQSPATVGQQMLRAVLAANSGATLVQITGASDGTIQTAVNAAVNIFADGA